MLATLGMTVFVFTLVLLLGNVLKEILGLVINRHATLGLALHAIALLIPYVLAFSLPIGMLTAALLVFGRFSADQELTAARASGISLLSLVSPVLLLSIAVSGLCAWLNLDIAPAYRMAYKELLYQAGLHRPTTLLQSGETMLFADTNGDHTIWVGKVQDDGTNLDDVIVEAYDRSGTLTEVIHGATGTMMPALSNKQILLNLQDAHSMQRFSDGWKPFISGGDATFPIKVQPQSQKAIPLEISDMTLRQLLDERDRLDRDLSESPSKGKNLEQLLKTQQELRHLTADKSTPVLVYLNRAVSFSFACIGFTLVGIPLGIRSHRRETSVGIATALILMLIYYSFIVLGQAWAEHAERAPYLIVWLPNFFFQAVGAVLLWRANRGV